MEKDVKKFQELEEYINELGAKPEELIAVLHRAQHIFGYLPREVQEFVADKLHINVSKVYGVVTFYSFFTMEKKGKYVINVCLGTACFVRGADKILREFEAQLGIKSGETTEDGLFTIEACRCVGACGLAPVVTVNDKVHGHLKPEDITKMIADIRAAEQN